MPTIQHIITKLKLFHGIGIVTLLFLFTLTYILGKYADLSTLTAQFILLLMAFVLTISYLPILTPEEQLGGEIPKSPLYAFFVLNILTTVLIWMTGIFQSPFILIYIILIIISSEIYHRKYGLVHVIVTLMGFVFFYTVTINSELIPGLSITSFFTFDVLFQPPIVIFVHTLIYTVLGILIAMMTPRLTRQ